MNPELKKAIYEALELAFYNIVMVLTWKAAAHYGLVKPTEAFTGFQCFSVIMITFMIGGWINRQYDNYLFKRRVKKAAVQIARLKGIDPKTLDFKNIKAEVDENGYMNIDIVYKKEKK